MKPWMKAAVWVLINITWIGIPWLMVFCYRAGKEDARFSEDTTDQLRK